jgi:hypothetical protein
MTEQIDQFFNPDGTLISIPVKSAKKIAVLLHIARDLSPTTKYPEKELNAIIAKYHDDTAAIRRHMIEYGILERDAESVYWLELKKLSKNLSKEEFERIRSSSPTYKYFSCCKIHLFE